MCKEELIALVQVSFNLNCDSLRQEEMVEQTLILVCFEYFTVLIFTLHSTELLRIIYVHQHVVCFCEVSGCKQSLWAGSWMEASRVSDPL